MYKVTEVGVSCRSNGLRNELTETKEGPLELRRQKEKGNGKAPGGKKGRGKARA